MTVEKINLKNQLHEVARNMETMRDTMSFSRTGTTQEDNSGIDNYSSEQKQSEDLYYTGGQEHG